MLKGSKLAQRFKQAIDRGDGGMISLFFDINHLMAHRDACEQLVLDKVDEFLMPGVWTECLASLFQAPLKDKIGESFQAYIEAASVVIRQFASLAPTVFIPCIRPISRSLRYFASIADYNECVNQLQKLLKAVKAVQEPRDDSSLLAVANALMATYFLRNNFKQAENLLKTVATDVNGRLTWKSFKPHEIATFRFNEGRTYAVKGEIAKAYDSLSFAWSRCPLDAIQNRRLILVYLVPVQLCRGYLPERERRLLPKYGLELYEDLANAVVEGNIAKYDAALEANQLVFIKLGLYELLSKARLIVFLQVVKLVHRAYDSAKVPISAVERALNLFEEFTFEDTVAVLSSLLDLKLIRAYFHMGVGLIVFKQQDAFPPIDVETF
jgi:hypothetical protein